MDHKDKKEQPTHLVTSVGQSLSIDQSARQKRYFISMMIRTVCFIAAVILPNPWRWVALFGAVTLPYVAVIAANAGRETIKGGAVYAGKYKELN
jgi:nucleoside recognition membrane protein YjiH